MSGSKSQLKLMHIREDNLRSNLVKTNILKIQLVSNRAKPAKKNTKFRNNTRSSMLPCSLGLTGRDLQKGTAMKAIK